MKTSLTALCAVVILGTALAHQASAQCLASGIYESVPILHYSCAFGLVDWTVSTWIIEDLGGGEISVTPGPGPLPVLLGTIDCDAMQFVATATLPGVCTEAYTIAGVILSETEWCGWFSATYTGSCFDCTSQFWTLGSCPSTAVPDGERPLGWGTIKALYRGE